MAQGRVPPEFLGWAAAKNLDGNGSLALALPLLRFGIHHGPDSFRLTPMMRDFWHAVRQLRKQPGFAAVAILTLALGIGANTAMFSVIHATLIRPLPFQDPEQLVAVWQEYPKRAWPRANFSFPNFLDLQRDSTFAAAGAYALSSHTLTSGAEPERLDTLRMSAGLLPTLGVQPALGRGFQDDEDRSTGERVALLSDHLWRARFQADPAIVGQSIRLNDQWSVRIVGVLPRDFRMGEERPDLCLPLRLDPSSVGRGQRGLNVIARRSPGVGGQELTARLAVIAAQLREADPWANAEMDLNAEPLHAHLVGEVRAALLALGGAVVCVLLIACANVANLSLARAMGRRAEMTIRAAVGAGRWQLVRALLAESLLLALMGGAVGLLLGKGMVGLAASFVEANLPQAPEITLDPTVLACTLAATLLSGILFGLLPALSGSNVDLARSMKGGGRAATGGISQSRWRGALVIGEVSLALVLLTGAGLLLKSLANLGQFHPGFDTSGMLVAHTVLAGNQYADNPSARLASARAMAARLEQLPGVKAVALGNSIPLTSDMDASGASISGRTFSPGDAPFAHLRGVGANYFQTLRIPLLEGRPFAASDHESGPKVAIINATMARKYWPEESALGKRLRPDALETKEWLTIVGVVADFKNESLLQRPRPEIFYAYDQFPTRGLSWMLRTTVPPMTLAESLRREIRKVDPSLAVTEVRTMDQTKADSFRATRFQTWLLGTFAGTALLLAATGIYGVLSYSVNQRSREIGIRMALGAQKKTVHALVIRGGMKVVLAGVGIGLVASALLTSFIAQLLFGIPPIDPPTFALSALLLVGVALVACYLPSRRAVGVDPMVVLRLE